ncbi:MAG: hypothetical protein KAI67_05980 [Candidatus Pacebacteria bacterium]|nr:hypothetical protein [Candidatus Paceibacterota bacterium]
MSKILFTIIFLSFLIVPFVGNASTLYFLPQGEEYLESDTFIKNLYIDTEESKINTIESKINFNQDILEAVDVITGDSVIELWVGEPAISNKNGSVEFIGGIPGGYDGNDIILKIIFKAKKTGNCNLYLSDTKILLNDGKATEDKTNLLNDSLTIIEKPDSFIEIKSNPDENKWIKSDTLSLQWDLVDEADYSYTLSRDPLVEPDEIPDKPEGELVWMGNMSYEGLQDDIYYFHLKQKLPNENWSPKITARVMIDTTSPEEFTPQITDIEEKKYLVFTAKDTVSGISHYEVSQTSLSWLGNIKPGQEIKWKTVKSPYLLKDQSLKSVIKVKAVDKAGNERLAEIVPPSVLKFLPCQIVFLILIGSIIIILIIRKLFLNRKRYKK